MAQIKQREPGQGEVLIESGRDGWYFVQIGRFRGVKRFNITTDEARQLVRHLCMSDPSLVPSLGPGWSA